MWDWSKVPESEHAELMRLYRLNQWAAIAKACEKWGVMPGGCCCNPSGLQNWFVHSIENGTIKNDDAKPPEKLA